ncbi:MAG: WG repeat-containing protein [Candidatus Obscuribacterales bacterium]|nr:WG repeat-containing protein [Candidatus Obscuribacterales bacterium]
MKKILSFIAISIATSAAYLYIHALDVEAVTSSFYASFFELTGTYSAKRAPVREKVKFGFIDNYGRFKIEPKLDDCSNFSEGLLAFRRGSSWGYMDISGKETIPPRFTKAADFHHGLALVRDGIYIGYIDRGGKFVLPAKYSLGTDFDDTGLAIVYIGRKHVFIVSPRGETLSDGNATKIYPQSEGTFTVESNGKYGLLDSGGKWLIMPEYDALTDCREGLLAFAKEGKWGYLNKQGKIVLSPVYTQAGSFCDGVAPVRRADGRCVLITHQGKTTFVFPAQCKAIFNCPKGNLGDKEVFEKGLVPVLENMMWGYISARSGKFEIKPQFAYAEPFENGRAKVAVLHRECRVARE